MTIKKKLQEAKKAVEEARDTYNSTYEAASARTQAKMDEKALGEKLDNIITEIEEAIDI